MSETKFKIFSETIHFKKRLLNEENAVQSVYKSLLLDSDKDEKRRENLKRISSRHLSTAYRLEERIKEQGESPEIAEDDVGARLKDQSPESLLEELRRVEKREYIEYDAAIRDLMLSNADKAFFYKRVLKRKRQNLRNMKELLPPEKPTPYHLTDLVRYLSHFIETKEGLDTAVAFNNGRAKVIVLALDAGKHLNEHKIPSETFLLVLEGAVVLEIEGEENSLRPMDSFDIPQNVRHSVRALTDSKFVLIH